MRIGLVARSRQPANISITNRREPNSPRLIGRLKPAPTYLLRAMQTLTPDSFCPLTNPQPYQREQAERPLTIASDASRFSVEVIESKFSRRSAVRSSVWLGPIVQKGLIVGEGMEPSMSTRTRTKSQLIQ